jgi:hypothetical protein
MISNLFWQDDNEDKTMLLYLQGSYILAPGGAGVEANSYKRQI